MIARQCEISTDYNNFAWPKFRLAHGRFIDHTSAMSTREDVLSRVEAFIASHGVSGRQFGILAVGDHRFVPRLRSGAGVTLTLIERAEKYMDGVEAGVLPLYPEPSASRSGKAA